MDRDFTLKDYLLNGIFVNLYFFVKYLPPPLGNIFRYLVAKPFLKKVGKCRIGEGVTIWYPYNIEIGTHVTINEFSYLSGYGGLQIGNHVRIGTGVKIFTSDHVMVSKDQPISKQGLLKGKVSIEDDVWIGANAIILKDIKIGKGAVIAAGAVITKDIPPFSINAGVPAKTIRFRE